ncbi:SDR family oxidoreductase [Mycolicibacterium sp. 018/SC-01/001]|uniref:SDR family oxidoreductase n=1 Tax=Mycolicibacterium sp. 018/SC-01/001 TaxID=2592069 RepID=UPI00117F5E17|nr:SDR family oxidoreductase [Mycolicibacterium sp. 018/SC-01/001]TRW82089.1 SDR family oxidoreductase [Mycolicibacterium sp. 018/SC-01/001]
MTSVLITGSSSGYGLATALKFLDEGWNVVATMRTPRHDLLPASDRLKVVALDVTDADSIANAVHSAGPIDVLVNNAGIGGIGPFESTPMATTRELFDTNTFGVMAVTQAVIPQMRTRRSGVIVNVTSSATLAAMPLAAVYTASKSAIEGFSGSLALEMGFFGVKVKLVEPGYGPSTEFTSNGAGRMSGTPEEYSPFATPIMDAFSQPGEVTTPADVADVVFTAATDTSDQLRFPAGADAVALARSTRLDTSR